MAPIHGTRPQQHQKNEEQAAPTQKAVASANTPNRAQPKALTADEKRRLLAKQGDKTGRTVNFFSNELHSCLNLGEVDLVYKYDLINNQARWIIDHHISGGRVHVDAELSHPINTSALRFVSALGVPHLTKRLLELGADPDAIGGLKNSTSLHSTAYKHSKPLNEAIQRDMELLLAYKANPNALDNNGNTPLDYGVWAPLLDQSIDMNTVLKRLNTLIAQGARCSDTFIHDHLLPAIKQGYYTNPNYTVNFSSERLQEFQLIYNCIKAGVAIPVSVCAWDYAPFLRHSEMLYRIL